MKTKDNIGNGDKSQTRNNEVGNENTENINTQAKMQLKTDLTSKKTK